MFLVVFRNRKRTDVDWAAYQEQADAMAALASEQPGFLSFKGFAAEDGEAVGISEWESAEAARAWGRVAEHRIAQRDGQNRWYAEYTLQLCDNPTTRRFKAKDNA